MTSQRGSNIPLAFELGGASSYVFPPCCKEAAAEDSVTGGGKTRGRVDCWYFCQEKS